VNVSFSYRLPVWPNRSYRFHLFVMKYLHWSLTSSSLSKKNNSRGWSGSLCDETCTRWNRIDKKQCGKCCDGSSERAPRILPPAASSCAEITFYFLTHVFYSNLNYYWYSVEAILVQLMDLEWVMATASERRHRGVLSAADVLKMSKRVVGKTPPQYPGSYFTSRTAEALVL
jgi:hypothetical protein